MCESAPCLYSQCLRISVAVIFAGKSLILVDVTAKLLDLCTSKQIMDNDNLLHNILSRVNRVSSPVVAAKWLSTSCNHMASVRQADMSRIESKATQVLLPAGIASAFDLRFVQCETVSNLGHSGETILVL